jgi:peptide deformylase
MASSRLPGCLPGRVASREIDQVNGIFFLDRLSRLKRDMAIKRWKKAQPG